MGVSVKVGVKEAVNVEEGVNVCDGVKVGEGVKVRLGVHVQLNAVAVSFNAASVACCANIGSQADRTREALMMRKKMGREGGFGRIRFMGTFFNNNYCYFQEGFRGWSF